MNRAHAIQTRPHTRAMHPATSAAASIHQRYGASATPSATASAIPANGQYFFTPQV